MFIYLLKFDWSFNASYVLVSIEVKHLNYRNNCDLWTTHTEIQNTTWKEMLKKNSLISNLVLIFYFDFILINVYIYLNASWWLICLQLYMNWRVLTTKVTLNSLFNDIIFLLFSTIHWPANIAILLFHFKENTPENDICTSHHYKYIVHFIMTKAHFFVIKTHYPTL